MSPSLQGPECPAPSALPSSRPLSNASTMASLPRTPKARAPGVPESWVCSPAGPSMGINPPAPPPLSGLTHLNLVLHCEGGCTPLLRQLGKAPRGTLSAAASLLSLLTPPQRPLPSPSHAEHLGNLSGRSAELSVQTAIHFVYLVKWLSHRYGNDLPHDQIHAEQTGKRALRPWGTRHPHACPMKSTSITTSLQAPRTSTFLRSK